MQRFFLNPLWTVLIDIAAWFCIHMGIAFGITLLPARLFNPRHWWFRQKSWERQGSIYETVFRVRRWKRFLPDGAGWFPSGFRKKRLKARKPEYVRRFIVETCRGECAHWLVIFFSPFFFLFNRWYVGIIMVAYALCANMPCIIAQRYNRPKLESIVAGEHRE